MALPLLSKLIGSTKIRKVKNVLKYRDEFYTPLWLKENLTQSEMRKEYSRLRSIANKRLERFKNTEWEDTNVYRYNKDRYVKLADVDNDVQLRFLLSDVSRFLSSKTGSITGLKEQRKAAINSLYESGYTFVNEKNFNKFTEFMEYSRIYFQNRLYDSERVANLFEQLQNVNITGDEMLKTFRKWYESNYA